MNAERVSGLVEALAWNIHEAECEAYTHEGRNARCERSAKAALPAVQAHVDAEVAAALEGAAELADTQIVLWSEVPGLHPEATEPHPAAIAAAGARRTLVVLRSRMAEAFAELRAQFPTNGADA